MRMLRPGLLAMTCALACGDDGGGDGTSLSTTSSAETGASSSSSDGSTSTTDASSTSSESGGDSSTSGLDESSSGATTGGAEDPSYPSPGKVGCPPDTAMVQLPGGFVCGPFCDGADAACPDPASGDAVPTCTPFEQRGGSGTPCTTHDDCMGEEACGPADTCIAVAFWACRLVCEGGETCSDGMQCLGGACGYE